MISSVKGLSPYTLQVEWDKITGVSEDVQSYIVEVINANITAEIKPVIGSSSETRLKHVFNDLQPNTRYDVRLQAENPSGLSDFSDIVSAKTLGERELFLFFAFTYNLNSVKVCSLLKFWSLSFFG